MFIYIHIYSINIYLNFTFDSADVDYVYFAQEVDEKQPESSRRPECIFGDYHLIN